jgi:phosphoribosylformimino-5-aminoimidazole carboxamide ribotide isomerase
MLILPLIKIKNGKSLNRITAQFPSDRISTDDPVMLATIFRGENFKALHISLLDLDEESKINSLKTVENIVKIHDIPIQAAGVFSTVEEVQKYFDIGCYRVVVNIKDFGNFRFIKDILDMYSPIKITVRLNSIRDIVYDCKWESVSNIGLIPVGLSLKEIGVKRILLSNFLDVFTRSGIDFGMVQRFMEVVQMKVTVIGGINNITDLKRISNFERDGIDSIIIGSALYQNRFCCESLWRYNEKFLDDLGPTRKI